MKILIVSHTFPPYNTVGTVRVGKAAKYLVRAGHEVRVLTAYPQPLPESLAVEIPPEWVVRTRWINLHAPAGYATGSGATRGGPVDRAAGRVRRILRATLWRVYREVVGYPDLLVGWVPFAVREGARLCRSWRPDLIYASAPPYSTLLAANRIARRTGIPWVAELRDLWVDTHDYPHSRLRLRFESGTEKRVLSTASALITVSEPLAELLRARHRAPVEVVRNGFDPEDFPDRRAHVSDSPRLRLAFTGTASERHQSPAPLFQAIAGSAELRQRVLVEFYGARHGFISDLARKLGVEENVRMHGPVPYGRSLQAQRDADALLFLPWGAPEQSGVLTGKLFEYLGACRPILAVGPREDEATRLIRSHEAGVVVHTVEEIRAALSRWLEEKDSGALEEFGGNPPADLTREAQTRRLAEIFTRTLAASRGVSGPSLR